MEFKIQSNALKNELGFVMGVIERKSTIPVLSNILIESLGENSIRITGTNLDVTIRCDAEANVSTPGAICVQGRKLHDLVRSLEDCEVSFKLDENAWVKMKANRSNFRLAGVTKEQFPETPVLKSDVASIPSDALDYMITHTVFATTKEMSRFTMYGAKFMLEGNVFRMVATDGHRLAFIEKAIEPVAGKIDTLVPKNALVWASRMARDGSPTVNVGEDHHHVYFQTAARVLIARKLSGNFPNYEMVMPKDNDKKVVFDLAGARLAVRRMALMADERNRSIRLTVRNGEIEVTAKSSEEGEGSEIINAEYSGDETLLGFNHQYLQEFLNVAATGTEVDQDGEENKTNVLRVAFTFKDANAATQCSIDGDTGYDYRYVVMPLRI